MTTMLNNASWLTVQEAADFLGVTDGRIRQLLRAGDLHGEKFGSTWALRKSDVESFGKIDRKPGNPNFTKSG